MRLFPIVLVLSLLTAVQVDAQSYVNRAVKQPNFQSLDAGDAFRNFFKRSEIEIGIGSIERRTITHKLAYDRDLGYDTWQLYRRRIKSFTSFYGGFNFYLPLAQPDNYSVYGIGFGLRAEAGMMDDPAPEAEQGSSSFVLTNLSMPVYFYSNHGAAAAFDSRGKYTWGWGLGYAATQYNNAYIDQSIITGYPLLYIEGGIFSASLFKIRLETNFGKKYQFYKDQDLSIPIGNYNELYFQEDNFRVFPFRASIIWNLASYGWERNKYRR